MFCTELTEGAAAQEACSRQSKLEQLRARGEEAAQEAARCAPTQPYPAQLPTVATLVWHMRVLPITGR